MPPGRESPWKTLSVFDPGPSRTGSIPNLEEVDINTSGRSVVFGMIGDLRFPFDGFFELSHFHLTKALIIALS